MICRMSKMKGLDESVIWIVIFFFQAEDGIRDGTVTGVQTCALPIFDGDIRLSRYDSTEQQGLFDQIMEAKPSTLGSQTDANNRTAIYDAVSVYLSRVADGTGRKVAVLFTDGVDTSSTTTLPELVTMVRGSTVVVYAIGFSGENGGVKGEGALNRLATVTGGAAYFPSSYRDIPGIYDRILADLSGQYVLGFTPAN